MGQVGRQYLLVMRHGLRQDEVDPEWARKTNRPWDPPLADDGLSEIATAAALIQGYGIKKVVSSPFLRCLQTASVVCEKLQPPLKNVEVDDSLCEILGPTYFAGAGGPDPGQSVEEWLWSGEAREAAWAKGLGSSDISATSAGTSFPEVPETLPEAHVRYTNAIEDAVNRAGNDNLLIITHGEAVGKSVTRLLPWVSVFLVRHCGFTVARRDTDADGEPGLWELDGGAPELERGVFWRDRAALARGGA